MLKTVEGRTWQIHSKSASRQKRDRNWSKYGITTHALTCGSEQRLSSKWVMDSRDAGWRAMGCIKPVIQTRSTIGCVVIRRKGWRDWSYAQDGDANPLFSPTTKAAAKVELEAFIHRSPRLLGLKRSRWWLDGLRQQVWWLRDCSLGGVQQLLHRLGVVYKRGRQYLTSPDPYYDLKLAYIHAARHLVENDPTRYVLLYQDELTYYRRPTLAQSYASRGNDAPYARLGHTSNKRRRIAASVEVMTGRLLVQQRHTFSWPNLLAFYRQLEAAYPAAQVIFLAQDNWPPHFHPSLLQAVGESKLSLLRLPTYAPWTNPVEKVWHWLKKDILHLHDFVDDWLGLQREVEDWLAQFAHGSQQLLRYVGLLPN